MKEPLFPANSWNRLLNATLLLTPLIYAASVSLAHILVMTDQRRLVQRYNTHQQQQLNRFEDEELSPVNSDDEVEDTIVSRIEALGKEAFKTMTNFYPHTLHQGRTGTQQPHTPWSSTDVQPAGVLLPHARDAAPLSQVAQIRGGLEVQDNQRDQEHRHAHAPAYPRTACQRLHPHLVQEGAARPQDKLQVLPRSSSGNRRHLSTCLPSEDSLPRSTSLF